MEEYICFYPSELFWVESEPDFDYLESHYYLYFETMSECIFTFENDEFYIALCRDGLIMLQFKVEPLKKDNNEESDIIYHRTKYLNIVNSIQLLLYSAFLKNDHLSFENTVIQKNEYFKVNILDGKIKESGAPQRLSSNYKNSRHNFNDLKYDLRLTNRIKIKEKNFITLVNDIKLIIANSEAIQILNNVNNAISFTNNLNFRQALIEAWFIIEYFLKKKWMKYLLDKQIVYEDKTKRINNDRMTDLIGPQVSAFIILNYLELNEVISFNIYKTIKKIESKRNIAIHNADLIKKFGNESNLKKIKKDIDIHDCVDAFIVIKEFVKEEYDLKLELNIGFSI